MKLAAKACVSCVLLGLLLWRVPIGAIRVHLVSFHATTLLMAAIAVLVCCGVVTVRLWCLLPEFRYRDLLHATLIARFYSTVIPGQIAGDVVKAYRLGQHTTRTGYAESATAVDRIVGVFALFLISAIASMASLSVPIPLRIFFVAGTVAIVGASLVAGSRPFQDRVVRRLLARPRGRIAAFARDFSTALAEHLHNPARLILAMAPALVFHIACVAIQMLLGNDLHMKLSWADWTTVYAGVSLVTMLPVSVAGLGLREGGYVGMLALFGYNASLALSLSFAILGTSLVTALVGGALELATVIARGQKSKYIQHRQGR